MSLDRSLKSANALIRHRNVLTRGERLDKLKEAEKWDETKSPFGLPKVAHRKMTLAKIKEEAPAEGAAATPGGAPAPAGVAPAAGGKAAAPAAGAKGAAPAPGGAAKAGAAPAKKK
jgi:small basic protein (TIGR04137 family)